jgi:hypothetical protein
MTVARYRYFEKDTSKTTLINKTANLHDLCEL